MAFRCPVEATAAVYRVSATLDGRTITGVTMEKKKVQLLFKESEIH